MTVNLKSVLLHVCSNKEVPVQMAASRRAPRFWLLPIFPRQIRDNIHQIGDSNPSLQTIMEAPTVESLSYERLVIFVVYNLKIEIDYTKNN